MAAPFVMTRLVIAGLLTASAVACSSGSEPVPAGTTVSIVRSTSSVTEATGTGLVASLVVELTNAGLGCERVDMAGPDILAFGALEEADAVCVGESLDIAVFPTAEQAEEYGRQAGYPYAFGDGWVIITETQTLAEQIAAALDGTVG